MYKTEKNGWVNYARKCPSCKGHIPKYRKTCPRCHIKIETIKGKVVRMKPSSRGDAFRHTIEGCNVNKIIKKRVVKRISIK
jgi:hypothetical protein